MGYIGVQKAEAIEKGELIMKNGDRVICRYKKDDEWQERFATVEEMNWDEDYTLVRMDDGKKVAAATKCLKVVKE